MKHSYLALSILTALACSSQRAPAASEKVLCLNLNGEKIHQAEILLSDKGIKISDRLGFAYWFPKQPGVVYIANPENKTYFSQSADEFIHDFRESGRQLQYSRVERKSKNPTNGMKTELVTAFLNDEHGHEIKVAEVTCLKNAGVAPATNRMWCAVMGYPEKDFSLPIGAFQMSRHSVKHFSDAFIRGTAGSTLSRITGTRRESGPAHWEVVAIPKKVYRKTVDERLLQLPTNYKMAKDKASLYLSTDGNLNQADLEDFFISGPRKKK